MAEEKYITTFINQSETIIWDLPNNVRSGEGLFRVFPGREYRFENNGIRGIYSPHEKIILKDSKNPERPDVKTYPRKSWSVPEDSGWVLELRNEGRLLPHKFIILTNFLACAPYGIPVFIYNIPAQDWEAEYEKIIFGEPEKHYVPEYGSGKLILVDKPNSASRYIRRNKEEMEILLKQRRRSAEIYMRDFIDKGGRK